MSVANSLSPKARAGVTATAKASGGPLDVCTTEPKPAPAKIFAAEEAANRDMDMIKSKLRELTAGERSSAVSKQSSTASNYIFFF